MVGAIKTAIGSLYSLTQMVFFLAAAFALMQLSEYWNSLIEDPGVMQVLLGLLVVIALLRFIMAAVDISRHYRYG